MNRSDFIELYPPENTILCFSGGIDSTAAYFYANKPKTVYFASNSRYMQKEMEAVQKLVPGTIIDYGVDWNPVGANMSREHGEKAYIPYRNLIYALLANHYADNIIIAGLADDVVDDKNENIFNEWSRLMCRMMGRPIRVTSPFWNMTKEEVVRWMRYNGHTKVLNDTVSCYDPNPETKYCGKCPSCFRKWVAFWNNGITLPFYNDQLASEYLLAAENNKYHKSRNASIIKAVTEWRLSDVDDSE